MWEGLRWLGYFVLALITVVVAVFAFYRIRGPSQAQREALAVMEKDYAPRAGRNAYPLLWYMQYDVPQDEVDARMAAEVAHVREQLAAGKTTLFSYEPSAKKLTEAEGDLSALCESRAPGCLAKVMADREAMRSALGAFPTLLARDEAFEQADFYWSPLPQDSRYIVAAHPGPAERVWLSSYALRYADGEHAAALAATCRNIGTWRRLHRGNNSLIGAMIAIANVDAGIRLYAEMLAVLSPDEAVPDECRAALVPVESADVDRCAEISGEFGYFRGALDVGKADDYWWERAQRWVLIEPTQAQSWRAEQLAPYCGETATRRMLRDETIDVASLPSWPRPECIASLAGCILAEIAEGSYIQYESRTLDFAAHLRLASTLLWLRDSPANEPTAQQVEKRPTELRSGQRKFGVDEAASALYVDNFFGARGPRFELPLRTPQPHTKL